MKPFLFLIVLCAAVVVAVAMAKKRHSGQQQTLTSANTPTVQVQPGKPIDDTTARAMQLLQHRDSQQREQGVAMLKQAAQQGVAEAQFQLALCYDRGIGTAKDTALCRSWLEKAAAQGHEQATLALAILNGETV